MKVDATVTAPEVYRVLVAAGEAKLHASWFKVRVGSCKLTCHDASFVSVVALCCELVFVISRSDTTLSGQSWASLCMLVVH